MLRNYIVIRKFSSAMFDATTAPAHDADEEIARYEVSEDGVVWRPSDPTRDHTLPLLHKRIEFAPPRQH